jgi:WD40 repeat protein
MLDLVDNCFWFVTRYFEAINTSAPHIYHSALILAPKKSIIQKLYDSYTHPFTRVVHGAPMSWDPNTMATTHRPSIDQVVWSPCNRFIAISEGTWQFGDPAMVVILDSVTFQQLQCLEYPQGISEGGRVFVFSPDSCILTCFGGGHGVGLDEELFVVSWDLQTGGVASVIRWQGPEQHIFGDPSITYSANGEMVGIFYWYQSDTNTAKIFICNVASGVCMHSHSLNSDYLLSNVIWTHGESLRFTTGDATTITIWEVGFTPGCIPTKIETLPTPDDCDPTRFPSKSHPEYVQLLPTPCRLALAFPDKVLVWDAQNSKYLLHRTDTSFHSSMSFSSDGQFFACSTTKSDIYLWKESPAGYKLYGTLPLRSEYYVRPLLSRNGQSIIVFGDHTIQLWRTNSFATHPSSTPTQGPQYTPLLVFSPDGTLAVIGMQRDTVVTVLDLKSGVPQLTIDTNMKVYGLGVVGNTVIVIGEQKVIAWDLPVGGCVPNARVDLEGSSWAVNLGGPNYVSNESEDFVISASISPDSCYIAIISGLYLQIYSASTGEYLGHRVIGGLIPYFSPDGCDIWCASHNGGAGVWRIGSGQNVLEHLEHRVDVESPPEGYPWTSSHGYQVTKDWWILSPKGKRLLMLPPPWRSDTVRRVWKGKYLALLHRGLSEPVILELEP